MALQARAANDPSSARRLDGAHAGHLGDSMEFEFDSGRDKS